MKKTYNKLVRDKIPKLSTKTIRAATLKFYPMTHISQCLMPSWMKSLPSTMQIKTLKNWQTCSRLFTQQPLLVDIPSKIWSPCGWKSEQNVVDLIRKFYLKASLARSETHILSFMAFWAPIYLYYHRSDRSFEPRFTLFCWIWFKLFWDWVKLPYGFMESISLFEPIRNCLPLKLTVRSDDILANLRAM